MRFQVPQFIEVEDKIFGPLTIKQFIYLAGGAGLCFVFYRFLPLFITIRLGVLTIAFASALAFYQINNKPFIQILQSAFYYFFSSKLYLWKKNVNEPQKTREESTKVASLPSVTVPKLSQSKLHDLSWSLDIKESLNPTTRENLSEK